MCKILSSFLLHKFLSSSHGLIVDKVEDSNEVVLSKTYVNFGKLFSGDLSYEFTLSYTSVATVSIKESFHVVTVFVYVLNGHEISLSISISI